MEAKQKPTFGIVAPVGEEPKKLLAFIKRAESSGFDCLWAGDHLVFMSNPRAYDVTATLGAAGLITKSILLGAISDPHRLHPAVLAQRVSTIDHLTEGRFILCLGTGEAMNLDPYGIKWDRPLSRLREAVGLIRSLWKSESPFDHRGEFYEFRGAFLGARPTGGTAPIYIAAHGDKSLETAAEIGDGWVTIPQPAELLEKKARRIEALRRRLGKPGGAFPKCVYLFASLAENEDEAYGSLEPLKYIIIWPELYEEAYGREIPEEKRRYGFMRAIPLDEAHEEGIRDLGMMFSREEILDFAVVGSPRQCIGRLERYIKAGATHFILHDLSPDRQYSLRALRGEVLPYFD